MQTALRSICAAAAAPSLARVALLRSVPAAGAAAAAHLSAWRPAVAAPAVSAPWAVPSSRLLHCSPSPLQQLDAQTLQQAAAWNLAARLGTAEEIEELGRWLDGFKRDSIPTATFELKHARSSGAGGQNVNKVNTKVDLRFKLDSASWMPALARRCLRELERGRINSVGEFVVTSERTRTQSANFEDCVDKLYAMITAACELPKATEADKVERIRKLAEAQKQKRRQNKTFQSDKKSSRRDWRD